MRKLRIFINWVTVSYIFIYLFPVIFSYHGMILFCFAVPNYLVELSCGIMPKQFVTHTCSPKRDRLEISSVALFDKTQATLLWPDQELWVQPFSQCFLQKFPTNSHGYNELPMLIKPDNFLYSTLNFQSHAFLRQLQTRWTLVACGRFIRTVQSVLWLWFSHI